LVKAGEIACKGPKNRVLEKQKQHKRP